MGKDAAGVDRTRPLYTVVHNDKKRVAYFYDSDIGNYAYVTGHPMKPHRIRLAHSLVMNYGVYKYLEVYRAKPAVFMEMTQFHTDEYIDFLQKVTPDNMDNYQREQSKYNVGDDCPVFDGLFEFCGISAGGSMEGAARLNRNKCDIAINWAGGLHHAKKSEASGFCYVNDIVLAIIELLRFNKRVLYIDIDVHHGDGVEEAFYTTDRVMTCSFHKYGEYFPGTGELRDIGIGTGKNYAVNFPLRDGITDAAYKTIFEPVISAIMQYYQPEAVVLQCGSDSLSGDRLGCFNLSMRGHANCVDFVRGFGLPTLVLGGGGYTMRNVARTWAYETGRLVGVEMDSALPYNEYYDYYGPDYELDVRASNMENANNEEYLEKIKIAVIENLKKTAPVPSVQMQDIPRPSMGMTDEEEAELDDLDEDDNENKDRRMTQRQWEKNRARQDEFDESDDEEMAQANGVNYEAPARRTLLDFRNPNVEYEIDSGAATPVTNGASATNGVKGKDGEEAREASAAAAKAEAAETEAEKTTPAAAADAKPEAAAAGESKDVAMEDADADAAAALTAAAAGPDTTVAPAADAADEEKTKMEVDDEAPATVEEAAVPTAGVAASEKPSAAAETTNGATTAAPAAATDTAAAKPAVAADAAADDDVEMADVASDEPAAPAAEAGKAVDTDSSAQPDTAAVKKDASVEAAAATVAGDAEAGEPTAAVAAAADDGAAAAKTEAKPASTEKEEPAATAAAAESDASKTAAAPAEDATAGKKDEAASSASGTGGAGDAAAGKAAAPAAEEAAAGAASDAKATAAGSETAAAASGKASDAKEDTVKTEQA